jgi:two-component system, sensor histidine kinase and response regulator
VGTTRTADERDATELEILNREAALAHVDGDVELLGEVAELFLNDCDSALAAIRSAIARGDAPSVVLGAHAFKGSLGSLAATEASAAAQDLETLAVCEGCAKASVAFERLAAALARLRPVLRELCR